MRLFLSISLIILVTMSCSLEESTKNQDSDLKALTDLGNEITVLVE